MSRFPMVKHLAVTLCFGTLFLVLGLVVSAQVADTDESKCAKKNGTWIESSPVGVNGDGGPAVTVTVNGPGASRVLGGQVKGLRDGIDNKWTFTCLMNPPQPPTVDNSGQRRCTPPGNDMSVEKCDVIGTQVSCEYVNAKNAPVKRLVMGACFLKPSAVQSKADSIFGSLVSDGWHFVHSVLHHSNT